MARDERNNTLRRCSVKSESPLVVDFHFVIYKRDLKKAVALPYSSSRSVRMGCVMAEQSTGSADLAVTQHITRCREVPRHELLHRVPRLMTSLEHLHRRMV